MKTLVLTACLSLAVAGSVFADGSLNWASISPGAMTAQTNMTQFSPLFGGGSTGGGTIGKISGSAALGTGFYFELLDKPFTGSQAADPVNLFQLGAWSDTGLEASNSNTAGRLVAMNATAGATVSWSPGITNSIMMVGWSANLGSTWGDALDSLTNGFFGGAPAFFGESATGYITPFAAGTQPGASVFGDVPTAQGLPIFSLNTQLYAIATPEPGTMALAGLGGLSLLALRRRK
jgi:hypothetical protein